ncbi:TMEM198/TM7SF3 family protein [Candidatus Saccharibacteria bacterium]|nr:MAG: TMEM198/TM7SF3 family protein [Candidatus Saccharibacteria bacterium]
MGEIIVGILAVLIGAFFAFQGGNLMRLVFPFVGFFAGFSAGAGLVSGITGDGFLSTVLGWVVGLVVALIFALLAYFFYAFAIVLAFAGLGFSLTAGVLSFFHLDWNWLVVLLGSVVGLGFGVLAVATNLPMVALIVATSFFGAAMVIYGMLLVFQVAQFGDFSSGAVYVYIKSHTGVYILWLTTGLAATLTQLRILGEQMKLTQEYWNSSLSLEEFVQSQNKKPAGKKKS